ncbi:hypothetical protein [Schaalia sp. lx-100]|uniref:hypothetical protein n=1 Tax=Schaalia sp. lx-100 TaxID=2899081 RepID=UPI001E35DDCF|nr:hypothetical protein [Schaalia sp. lx-100]MCD4557635.1 hypothetical protein [Schaalia sp. lx-100]
MLTIKTVREALHAVLLEVDREKDAERYKALSQAAFRINDALILLEQASQEETPENTDEAADDE